MTEPLKQGSAEPAFGEREWKFDERVTAQFDEMLERSIPQYEVMRQTCFEVGKQFVEPETDIVDLGCSRGEAVSFFLDSCGVRNRYVLVEASEPMFEAVSARYADWVKAGVMKIFNKDLRTFYPMAPDISLTLSVLTLMFTPIEYRLALVQKVYESIKPGGAFILVEKVLGASAAIDEVYVRIYHEMKSRNGYSAEEIQRKKLALEGKLVPVTANMNEDFLRSAGFRQVDCFWRWANFAGWLAIK
jgi:tRNA (cmo5U34)-methyltransferase